MISRTLRRLASYATKTFVPDVEPAQFYHVVRDVSAYPKFLMWVESTKIMSRKSDLDFDAEMSVNFKVYRGSFESRAVCEENRPDDIYKVTSVARNSPVFTSMVSEWVITRGSGSSREGCTVSYSIDFNFKNMLYQSASSYFLSVIGKKTMNLFVGRAESLYAKSNI